MRYGRAAHNDVSPKGAVVQCLYGSKYRRLHKKCFQEHTRVSVSPITHLSKAIIGTLPFFDQLFGSRTFEGIRRLRSESNAAGSCLPRLSLRSAPGTVARRTVRPVRGRGRWRVRWSDGHVRVFPPYIIWHHLICWATKSDPTAVQRHDLHQQIGMRNCR